MSTQKGNRMRVMDGIIEFFGIDVTNPMQAIQVGTMLGLMYCVFDVVFGG